MGEGAQQPPGGQRVIHGEVEPAPPAWSGMQMLALAAILVLGGLKFLPATHFHHPADRGRNCIPFDPSRHPAVRHSGLLPAAAFPRACLALLSYQKKLYFLSMQGLSHQVVAVDIFSWISCMDLRTIAVLANSTLSSSRFSPCDSHVCFNSVILLSGPAKLAMTCI
jgi:hypothetical protein